MTNPATRHVARGSSACSVPLHVLAVAMLGFLLAACETVGENAGRPNITKESLMRMADAARDGMDFPVAVQFYSRAIEEGAEGAPPHLGLARSLLGVGQFDAAAREYQKVATLEPSNPEADLGMGRVDLGKHDPQHALESFDRAFAKGAQSAAAYDDRGITLDLLGRHADAQQVYRAGLARMPEDRSMRNNLGLSLALSGKYDQAVGILTELARDPNATSRNRQNLALALGLSGDSDEARVIALHDLSEAQVQSNLRFYKLARDSAPVDR